MKRVAIGTILFCTAVSVVAGQPPTTTNVRVGVDLRAELFAIIWRLAGSHVYNMGTLEPYVSEIDRHFGPHRDHEAVVRARELLEMGADFSAVMTIAIHTTGPYELRGKVPLEAPGGVLERRGMPEPQRTEFANAVRRFREAARDFVEVARAREFFEAHQPLYDTAGARLRRVIEENADLAWFDDFFGTSPGADFIVVPLLATSEVNFGPSLPGIGVRPERYAFLSTRNDGIDSAGFPVYPVRLVRTLVHEFNHSYVDDLLQDHAHRFAESGPAVFGLVGDRMRAQGYSEWRVVLAEALVDAAVARYVLAHDGPEAARADIAEERADGHIYMEELFEWLGEYESNRATCPTLDAFMPTLAVRFAALVQDIEDEAAIAALIEEVESANNAGDVERWVSLFADDAVYMAPGAPPVTTREGLIEVATAGFRHEASIDIEPLEIRVADEWAFARNRVTGSVTLQGSGEVVSVDVKQIVIYERDDDGDWRIARMISNSNTR